jgi:hypothetical protein
VTHELFGVGLVLVEATEAEEYAGARLKAAFGS